MSTGFWMIFFLGILVGILLTCVFDWLFGNRGSKSVI